MKNNKFKELKKLTKKERIARIISEKARSLSPEQVDQVLNSIDFNKQFLVTGMRNKEDFLKNCYEESYTSENTCYEVKIETLLGEVSLGFVSADEKIEPQVYSDQAVILRKITISSGETLQHSYVIVILN